MNTTSGYVCDRGLNPKRPVNQDRYLVDPVRRVFAVFDGVGGQRAGEIASQTAADTVEEALALDGRDTNSAETDGPSKSSLNTKEPNTNSSNGSCAERIRSAIRFANRDIYELASNNPEYETMATTVALVQIEDNLATIAHVGDSRVYRLERGQLHRETIDHTDFDDRMRAGLVQPGIGATNDSHIINRALGSAPDVEVEIKTIRFSDGARFLVCTDGVYRMLPDDEIGSILAKYEDPQGAADELKRVAHERGADDNLTAVVVHTGRERADGERGPGNARWGRLMGSTRRQETGRTEGNHGRLENRERLERQDRGGTQVNAPDRISIALDGGASGASRASRPKGQVTPNETRGIREVVLETGKRPALWILLLAGLVLLSGGFYLGLRFGDWRVSRAASRLPAVSTGNAIETGRRALEGGDYSTAEQLLSKVVVEQPANVQANYWLGRTELAEGKLQEAVHHFDAAINLEPNLLDAYLQEAGAYEAMGDKSKAAETLARYLEARRKAQPHK